MWFKVIWPKNQPIATCHLDMGKGFILGMTTIILVLGLWNSIWVYPKGSFDTL